MPFFFVDYYAIAAIASCYAIATHDAELAISHIDAAAMPLHIQLHCQSHIRPLLRCLLMMPHAAIRHCHYAIIDSWPCHAAFH